ncbi:MAG: hypothetical protein KGL90_13395 [Burkholderiales bacterium]|nr:hypothetical protein [Burkholderiales bacterium]
MAKPPKNPSVRPPLPIPLAPSHTTNLFDASKPGQAVVRPNDLLALRLQLINLKVLASASSDAPPRLERASDSGDAFIVLHFPPQSVAEQAFFETVVASGSPDVPPTAPPPQPDVNPPLGNPPVRARMANESRLVFAVPKGFSVPYRLADVLDACQQLALQVPANALPRTTPPVIIVKPWPLPFKLPTAQQLAKMPWAQRVRLSSAVARQLNQWKVSAIGSGAAIQPGPGSGKKIPAPHSQGPRPQAPTATQTAIELPWRLILSPHAGERWHHASTPVTSALTDRTELWHTRLVAPAADGAVIEPPQPDANRTVRAVWALTGEGSSKAMQGQFPVTADLPSTAGAAVPFLTTLSDFDRFQIVHLSSNFSEHSYTPPPVDDKLLLLSSLGAWFDARGAFDPPGLALEEWNHRTTMGRDHYVRVVYKGFLFPFGHRVALIKVTERKFHNGAIDKDGKPVIEFKPGNPAYLRQRMFIIVRERERLYGHDGDESLVSPDSTRVFKNQWPFKSVKILTTVTPNLDAPQSAASAIGANGQSLFWPCVNGQPFGFRCVATDQDDRRVEFEQPLIFMDNTFASPRQLKYPARPPSRTNTLQPAFAEAEGYAKRAFDEWNTLDVARAGRRSAALKRQRVTLAPSQKAGDTAVEVETLELGAEYQARNNGLRSYSNKLSRPVFYPRVMSADVRVAALAHLTGSGGSNRIQWNAHYLAQGFDASNKGEVFADIAALPGMAQLDFSKQGDRSGGFVMPNIKPSALSRLTGPVTGSVSDFVQGQLKPASAFPSSLSDLPLPLLFGCIPLGAVIEAVADLSGSPQRVPKFASEAASQVESLVNALMRAFDFVRNIGSQGGSLAQAAKTVVLSTLQDLLDQAQSLAAAQVTPVISAIQDVQALLQDASSGSLSDQLKALLPSTPNGDLPGIDSLPNLGNLGATIDALLPKVALIGSKVDSATLPSGFKQSVKNLVAQATAVLTDLKTLAQLIPQGKALFAALDAVVGHPESLGDLFTHPDQLGAKLTDIQNAIAPIRTTLADFRLLDGAARKTLLAALDGVTEVLGLAADLTKLLQMLTGDELTVHFDWSPEINSWGFKTEPDGSVKPENQLFRANDRHGFVVAVEAKVKKSGGTPKISVVCGLKHFDLVLIAPASFLELNFEKIEFSVDTSAKMNVDVLLHDIKFVGPLSFVETLRSLIPLDGFSDPPHLDITPQGIDAGFSVSLPNIAVGMFSLTNLSLGAGFTVPFIGQPLSVRFNFCTREQPFNLTVSLFGGGGFFGVTIDPSGVQILEAAFEFGASISVDFGVASGGVHVMAGVYFRMEKTAASLTGYFRLGGHVSVLGLISASLELYLELRYEFDSGKVSGKAQLTIEVSVFMFSASVTVTCERKFSGSNGDPSFRQLMGLQPALDLVQELTLIDDTPGQATDYAWRDYVEAFA